MEKLIKLSLNDINLFKDDENQDFAIAELEFLASGNNGHKNPISEETLRRCAHSALGKFVVGEYDKYTDDVTTHTEAQSIYGYIPPNSEIEFREKDDRIFAVCQAVVSKLYATEIVQMFKKENFRNVSVEFTCITDEIDDDGNAEITDFTIRAITVLGKGVEPSCDGANIELIKFSKDDATEYFNSSHKSSIDEFLKNRMSKMSDKIYKINTSAETLSDKEWDGDKAKKDAVKAKNFKVLAPKIFLRLKKGWEDKKISSLSYPVMELDGDTWVYNRKAISSAEGYAKQENDTAVIEKVLKIKKELGLDEKEKESEDTMSKKFENELEGRELYAKVIELVKENLGDGYYVEDIYDDKIVLKDDDDKVIDVPADIKVGADDKDMDIKIDFDKIKKEFAEVDKKMDDDDGEDDDDKKTEEEVEKEEEMSKSDESKEKEEEMSLDSMVDMSAYLQMLENETDDYKALAEVVAKEMSDDKTIVMKRVLDMAKERDELKGFKAEKLAEQKEFEINKILMEVKEDLKEEEFEKFKKEGMECEFEQLGAFENTVKAHAYQNSKMDKKEDDKKEFAKMAFSFENHIKQKDVNVDDIYNKY